MKTGHQYRETLSQLQTDLQARVEAAYAAGGAAQMLFDEPWNIGATLNDTTHFEASGLTQRDHRTVVLDVRHGGDYALEKMPVEDLVWLLITLEAGRFRQVAAN